MQIIENMDKKWRLWCKEGDESFVEAEEEEHEEKVDESKMDSESTETVKLEKMAFSSIKPTEPKYLKHQVSKIRPEIGNSVSNSNSNMFNTAIINQKKQ